MPDPSDLLARECEVFVRFLTPETPNDYVIQKYRNAHDVSDDFEPRIRFDELVIRIVRAAPFLLPAADAFSRIFASRSTLRKKLVLTLALLETVAPYHVAVNQLGDTSRPLLFAHAAGHTVRWALNLALGIVVFLPVRAFTGGAARG